MVMLPAANVPATVGVPVKTIVLPLTAATDKAVSKP